MKLTTAFLCTLDRQDVFDVIAWRLLFQNARARAADGIKNLYRSPDGKRCAIGWIMPDDVYAPEFESKGIREIAAYLAETDEGKEFAAFVAAHVSMLCDLQGLHDAYRPDEWPNRLHLIAQKYDLSETVIERMCDTRPSFAPPPVIGPQGPVASGCLLDLDIATKIKRLPRIETLPVELSLELEAA